MYLKDFRNDADEVTTLCSTRLVITSVCPLALLRLRPTDIYICTAETLKYYYLLFLDEDPLHLDKIVFTTEAHPLPVFKWSSEDISWFKIPV